MANNSELRKTPRAIVFEEATRLHIAIDQIDGDRAAVMKALQECAEGRCACPTTQYARLQGIELAPSEGGVSITLTPKQGEVIDRQAIDRCLEYTLGKASV
jgi:hypothetical protein